LLVSAFDASSELAKLTSAPCGFEVAVRQFEGVDETPLFDGIPSASARAAAEGGVGTMVADQARPTRRPVSATCQRAAYPALTSLFLFIDKEACRCR